MCRTDFKLKHLLPPERLAQFAAGMQWERLWGCPGEMGSRRQTPEPSQALLSATTWKTWKDAEAEPSDTPAKVPGSAAGPKVHPCAASPVPGDLPAQHRAVLTLGKPRGQRLQGWADAGSRVPSLG